MSKELAFTDDNDVVKYLDTTTSLNLALTGDGLAFDLTNAKTIVIKIANDDGYIMDKSIDLTQITNLLNGTIIFLIDQEVMTTLVPDDYDIEVWVTMNDGTQAIFPSDGTLGFSIEENLMSDTGEVIPTITLNDFQQQFNDLSSQMENAVHNVQKGDQGNPGNGIKAANNQYQLSDSPVTVPTGNWSDNILVTTDQAPYLWTKIIFTYDDGTTKEINFVSSRGDTGSQGPIGPVGPQGKQGNGLVVRGKADKEENLPTIGNNQGDGYLVGTNLYIWIDGSWQNMGSITPDLTDYVKVTDMRKPASDVAGIEEVNAKQDAIAYTPADDNKVVHNSGAEEIADQKTFDIAPIDKTTGNPYITKDGVPQIDTSILIHQGDVIGSSNYMLYFLSRDVTAGQLKADGTVDTSLTDFKTLSSIIIPSGIKNFIFQSSYINFSGYAGNIIAFYDINNVFISLAKYDATTSYQIIDVPDKANAISISTNFDKTNGVVSLFAGTSYIDSNSYPTVQGLYIGNQQAATQSDVTSAVNTATSGLAKESDISGFYHQNADDSSAQVAAKSATTAGIYWYPVS